MAIRVAFGVQAADGSDDIDFNWSIDMQAAPRAGDEVLFPADSGCRNGVVSAVFWTPGSPDHDVIVAIDPTV